MIVRQVTKLIVKADMMTFLFSYLGWDTSLNTAEGIENCASVIDKDKVYSVIAVEK